MGFTGTLSPQIGNLKALNTLYVSNKSLSLIDFLILQENVFIWLCTPCSQLQGNGITGMIPEELGNLSSLTMLDLENNNLTGEIPSSLGNLRRLTFL